MGRGRWGVVGCDTLFWFPKRYGKRAQREFWQEVFSGPGKNGGRRGVTGIRGMQDITTVGAVGRGHDHISKGEQMPWRGSSRMGPLTAGLHGSATGPHPVSRWRELWMHYKIEVYSEQDFSVFVRVWKFPLKIFLNERYAFWKNFAFK